MTTVKVKEASATPAALAAVKQKATITDDQGRVITLEKPATLAQFRLVRMLGADAAANQQYVMMLFPLLYVTAIDNDPVFFPAKEQEIELLITRLGDDGVAAVVEGVQANFANQSPKEQADAIRK